MRYVVVETATGLVLNAVEWDGVAPWAPDSGTHLVPAPSSGGIGDTYDGSKFVAPPVVLNESEIERLANKLVEKGVLSRAEADDLRPRRGR